MTKVIIPDILCVPSVSGVYFLGEDDGKLQNNIVFR